MKIKNHYSHDIVLIHTTVTVEESTINVIFKDISHMPPYRIENLSMEVIRVKQINTEYDTIIPPFTIVSYAWD